MEDNNKDIQSPDGLDLKGNPGSSSRIGKKAGAIVVGMLAIAGLVVAVNIATKKPAGAPKKSEETAEVKDIKPATQAADDMNRKAGEAKPKKPEDMIASPPDLTSIKASAGQTGQGVPNLGAARGNTAGAPDQPPQLSPEEVAENKLEEERRQRRRQALEAGSTAKFGENSSGGLDSGRAALNDQRMALAQQMQQAARGAGGANNPYSPGAPQSFAPGQGAEWDQNRQADKQAFLERAAAKKDVGYLTNVRRAPLSPYEIKAGTVIPAVMIDGINSDLPGDIVAQVSENVYDSTTGRHLLIPQGTKIYGTYDSQVAYGQNGLQVVWSRLNFPDSSVLDIGGMGGADQSGYSGFRDEVNNHYGRIFGFGLVTSLFTAAFQLSQPQQNSINGQLTASQQTGAAVGQQMSQLGIELARKNLRIQPTIEVRPGYRFVVKVNKDVVFPGSY